MPVDFSAPEGAATPQNDGSMFAPTPLWDRDVKKRRGRRAAASRPVSDPAMDAGEAGAGAGVIGATTAAEPADAAYETQPAVAGERVTARRRGVPAAAVAAGAVAIAAVAAIGWYASRPHDNGLAQLTPGAPATSEAALATAAPPTANQLPAAPTPPVQTASTASETTTTTATTRAATPVATRRTHTTIAARAPAPRVRPAESNSAMDAGVNASTTAPMLSAPTPAPVTPPAMDAGPVNPVTPTTPSVTAPQPIAPTSPAPGSDPTITP